MYLVLENGSVQRHETGQRDPAIVLFDSYAFDLSTLSTSPQNIKYSVRERYLWELYDPREPTRCSPTSRVKSAPSFTTASPRRSTRSLSVVMTYAYLGAPRTTRQRPHHVAARRHRRRHWRCAASASSA